MSSLLNTLPPLKPFAGAAAVTPSDSTALTNTAAGLYIGGAGAVKVGMPDGSTPTFSAVPAGTVLNAAVTQVYSTGTTATNILALY